MPRIFALKMPQPEDEARGPQEGYSGPELEIVRHAKQAAERAVGQLKASGIWSEMHRRNRVMHEAVRSTPLPMRSVSTALLAEVGQRLDILAEVLAHSPPPERMYEAQDVAEVRVFRPLRVVDAAKDALAQSDREHVDSFLLRVLRLPPTRARREALFIIFRQSAWEKVEPWNLARYLRTAVFKEAERIRKDEEEFCGKRRQTRRRDISGGGRGDAVVSEPWLETSHTLGVLEAREPRTSDEDDVDSSADLPPSSQLPELPAGTGQDPVVILIDAETCQERLEILDALELSGLPPKQEALLRRIRIGIDATDALEAVGGTWSTYQSLVSRGRTLRKKLRR